MGLASLSAAINTVVAIDAGANQFFRNAVIFLKQGKAGVWANPNATPIDIITAMGTGAVTRFTQSQALATVINTVTPGSVDLTPPAGWVLTINADGTGTAVFTAPA